MAESKLPPELGKKFVRRQRVIAAFSGISVCALEPALNRTDL